MRINDPCREKFEIVGRESSNAVHSFTKSQSEKGTDDKKTMTLLNVIVYHIAGKPLPKVGGEMFEAGEVLQGSVVTRTFVTLC